MPKLAAEISASIRVYVPGLPEMHVEREGIQIGAKYEGPLIPWSDFDNFLNALIAAHKAGREFNLCPDEFGGWSIDK